MTKHLEALRAELVAKIREANRIRREAAMSKEECDHDWQPFIETVTPDNDNFKGSAVFKLIGCPKCKRKSYQDLTVTTV